MAEYFDIEQNSDNEQKQSNGLGYNKYLREGFVQKVYLILSMMMISTVFMCFLSIVSKSWLLFQIQNQAIFYLCIFACIAILCVLGCTEQSRNVPTNYILLSIFTFCQGYMVSFSCGIFPQNLVISAAFLTLGMFCGLTYYACTTKTDFTMMGGLLSVLCVVLIVAVLLQMFLHLKVLQIIIEVFGVLLFSVYIIYDTQLIIGGDHKNQFELDDYILAAVSLYLDIINLFMFILQFLQSVTSSD